MEINSYVLHFSRRADKPRDGAVMRPGILAGRDCRANPQRHPQSERGQDLYETPAGAVHALLGAETLPHRLWEPAAGRGAIVRVLRDAGHAVIASDLIAFDFALHFQRDFLTTDKAPDGVEAIVTNPPFHIANEFVAHALMLCPRVVMLLRLAFLESARRSPILEEAGLARIHIFRRRLPMMNRDGWDGPRASSQTAFAWFIWDRDHVGPPTIHRIDATTSLDRNGCSSHPSCGVTAPEEISNPKELTMSKENTAPKLVSPLDPAETSTNPDPFDVESLRLDQSFLTGAGVKRLLTTIPVRKPDKQDWIRVHADKEYRLPVAMIELKEDREFYLLPPPIARQLPGEFVMVTLYVAINRQGTLFLWPVKIPDADGKVLEWHRSAAAAAELAMTQWVRVKANMNLGAYEIFEAGAKIPDPEWPSLSYQELLRIAFKDRYVDSIDHLVVQQLRGLV